MACERRATVCLHCNYVTIHEGERFEWPEKFECEGCGANIEVMARLFRGESPDPSNN